MLEDAAENVKRYAPPPQRNRVLNRRKSGDRFEKVNYSYDGEKNQAHGRTSVIDNGEVGNSKGQNENPYHGMIPINGCCNSEAAQLLNDRWAAAMQSYNDPSVDSSERPLMFSGASGSSWGHLKLPHQMDFLAELRRAIHSAEATKGHLGVRSGVKLEGILAQDKKNLLHFPGSTTPPSAP